jgi:hypothetical protein
VSAEQASARRTLTLFGRDGCHLCEDALALIEASRPRLPPFRLEVIDIDLDQRLHDVYFERIPVLALDGRELCEYFVEEETLLDALAAGGTPPERAAGAPAGSRPDAGQRESPR